MTKKTKDSSGGMKLFVLGASLAGIVAAYFFLSPKEKKNLKNAKSWAIKMKADVVEKLEKAREVSETMYNDIIDSVATQYVKKSATKPEEIKKLAKDLKKHWPALSVSIEKKLDKEKSKSKKKSK